MDMASPAERNTNLNPGRVVIAYDATKDRNCQEMRDIVADIMSREGIIQEVDTITVLGVLHKVLHPMGFQMQIGPEAFMGTQIRAIKEEVSRKVGICVGMLQKNAVECGEQGVTIEVRTVVGAPMKKVIVHEVAASNATWIVLDRYLKKDLKFYLKNIPCKFALVLDNLSLDILRPYFSDKIRGNIEHKTLYSQSRSVPLSPMESLAISSTDHVSTSSPASSDSGKSSLVSDFTYRSKEQSISSPDDLGLSPVLELGSTPLPHELGSNGKVKVKYNGSSPVMQKRSMKSNSELAANGDSIETKSESNTKIHNFSKIQVAEDDLHGKENCLLPVASDELVPCPHKAIEGPLRYSYSEIQNATDGFSFDNILGEGGYGIVYKGQLKDGQLITVKVQKEESTQAAVEFHSEIRPLRFVLHGNIAMLLGYCYEESIRILVYEYISNKSLEWHLFDNTRFVLEWKHRHSIAIGTAKALRFLHEECRGNPIIHQDVRPTNILLTHDFVPMLGDCGLAKWRTNKSIIWTKTLENLVYRAPEYLENGICSEKTDVFAYGIILLQLISGRKTVDSTSPEESLAQWALPLIKKLALEELVDPRLGHSYSTYQLYLMARAAYLCVQTKVSVRPTMGEVLLLLEGKNDHLRLTAEQSMHHHNNV